MMNRFLITALIATGLGLRFAPVANSQTSDTAEVEFTGTLESDCSVENVTPGALAFSPDGREINVFTSGRFDYSDGCGFISTIIVNAQTPDNAPLDSVYAFISVISAGVVIDTRDNLSNITLPSTTPGNLTSVTVNAFADNSTPLTPGDYSIIVAAILTAN